MGLIYNRTVCRVRNKQRDYAVRRRCRTLAAEFFHSTFEIEVCGEMEQQLERNRPYFLGGRTFVSLYLIKFVPESTATNDEASHTIDTSFEGKHLENKALGRKKSTYLCKIVTTDTSIGKYQLPERTQSLSPEFPLRNIRFSAVPAFESIDIAAGHKNAEWTGPDRYTEPGLGARYRKGATKIQKNPRDESRPRPADG